MHKKRLKKFHSAIWRVPLSIVATQTLALLSVQAQTVTNQAVAVTNNTPIDLGEVVVTGRLTPTADTVGPYPLQTITSEDIQKAGTMDVLSTLVKLNPGFSGNANSIGQANNNNSYFNGQPPGTGESFAALRNMPTLILVDGRRVCNSPLSQGQGMDLNLIPVNMIERIEVLEDGASAQYGSDAIGGVINIITKKNYNGAEVSQEVGFPTDQTGNNVLQYQSSILAGISSDNTRLVVGAQLYHTDPVQEQDRINTSPTALLNAGLLPDGIPNSPTFPGRIDDVNGVSYVLAGSQYAAGAPGYRPGLNTPPIVSGGPFPSVSAYNAAATTQLGYAPYIPLSSTPLGQLDNGVLGTINYPFFNTSQFGTYSLLEQDRYNVSMNLEHDLLDKRLTLFGNFMFAQDDSQSELAPAPGPYLEQANLVIPANNPYNPFDTSLGGPVNPPNIRTRYIENGNRIYDTTSDLYSGVAGIKGVLNSDYSYEVAGTYSREDQTYLTHNAINGAVLNQALIPNGQVNSQGQPLSMLKDANGNSVPVFNYFGLGGNSPATLNAISTTLSQSGYSDLWSADGKIVATPSFLELPAGPVAIALGGEFIQEGLDTSVDPLTLAGLSPGINQAFPASGTLQRYAAFTEVNIPVFSENNQILGFHSLEATLAGRFEDIQPGGTAAVPKVGIRWQPVDNEITLRASYSEGFNAPSIYNLYGPNSSSADVITLPDGTAQQTIITTSNPNLKPSNSEQWNGGVVFSPKAIPGLTVSADFYYIQEDNVPVADYTSALTSLNASGSASPYASGYYFSDGSQLTTTSPNQVLQQNFGSLTLPVTGSEAIKTEGFDYAANYIRPISLGTVTVSGNVNWTLNYEVQANPGTPYYNYVGQGTYGFGTAQGIIPDYKVNCSFTWDFKGFRYNVSANYLPGVTIPGNLFPAATFPGATQGSTVNGLAQQIGSYYSIDMQISYEFGLGHKIDSWYDGLRFTAGCNNITDTPAPLIAGGPDYSDNNTYNPLGRFVYFEVSKKF
jgi:iron complex outermembrane receptor protein